MELGKDRTNHVPHCPICFNAFTSRVFILMKPAEG